MAALGGVNKIFYPGTMEGALTVSKEGLVLDDEIAAAVYRLLAGIRVEEATLAVDVVNQVGPGGHFLKQRHTMQFLTGEHFLPKLANRQTREKWLEAAGRTWPTRRARAWKNPGRAQTGPAVTSAEAELERIVREVESREAKRG
jgi:trimethylamine--corrinoid protein Co-methyltransferase